jgi:hypothetical protein
VKENLLRTAKLRTGSITKEVAFEYVVTMPQCLTGHLPHAQPVGKPDGYRVSARLSAPFEDTEGGTLILDDGSEYEEIKVWSRYYVSGKLHQSEAEA